MKKKVVQESTAMIPAKPATSVAEVKLEIDINDTQLRAMVFSGSKMLGTVLLTHEGLDFRPAKSKVNKQPVPYSKLDQLIRLANM